MEALADNKGRVILFGGFEELTRRIAGEFIRKEQSWDQFTHVVCLQSFKSEYGTFQPEE